MFTSMDLLKGKLPDVRVGVGCGTNSGIVERSARVMDNNNVMVYRDPGDLVDDLYSGRIEAAVRGDMSSSKLLPILKERAGVRNLERLVLLEPPASKMFFLTPVGIDEGWSIDQKYDMAVRSVDVMKRLGTGTRIAVMSGGRKDDKGRNDEVDKTLKEAVELTERLVAAGYDAYDAQILIEAAVDDADLIVASNGIVGNLVFRIIHFIGGAKALGAPVINIDKVFIDTSREKNDYVDSIQLAQKMTEVIH